MLPQSVLSFCNPGTESFVKKYASSIESAFRMVAEDRLRNLVLGGEIKEACRISRLLLKEAANYGVAVQETVKSVADALGLLQ